MKKLKKNYIVLSLTNKLLKRNNKIKSYKKEDSTNANIKNELKKIKTILNFNI